MGRVSAPPSGGSNINIISVLSTSQAGRSSVDSSSATVSFTLNHVKQIKLTRTRAEGQSPSAVYKTSAMSSYASLTGTVTIDAKNLTSLACGVTATNPQGTSGQGPYTVAMDIEFS